MMLGQDLTKFAGELHHLKDLPLSCPPDSRVDSSVDISCVDIIKNSIIFQY